MRGRVAAHRANDTTKGGITGCAEVPAPPRSGDGGGSGTPFLRRHRWQGGGGERVRPPTSWARRKPPSPRERTDASPDPDAERSAVEDIRVVERTPST